VNRYGSSVCPTRVSQGGEEHADNPLAGSVTFSGIRELLGMPDYVEWRFIGSFGA